MLILSIISVILFVMCLWYFAAPFNPGFYLCMMIYLKENLLKARVILRRRSYPETIRICFRKI